MKISWQNWPGISHYGGPMCVGRARSLQRQGLWVRFPLGIWHQSFVFMPGRSRIMNLAILPCTVLRPVFNRLHLWFSALKVLYEGFGSFQPVVFKVELTSQNGSPKIVHIIHFIWHVTNSNLHNMLRICKCLISCSISLKVEQDNVTHHRGEDRWGCTASTLIKQDPGCVPNATLFPTFALPLNRSHWALVNRTVLYSAIWDSHPESIRLTPIMTAVNWLKEMWFKWVF
jgi:hypothetical protein